MARTNLNRRFLVGLNGHFVSKLSNDEAASLAASREEKQPLSMGDRDQAAVITLQNALLLWNNGITFLVLGRCMHEVAKLEPMPRCWASQFDRVKSVQYTGDGDEVQLESFGMFAVLSVWRDGFLADFGVDFPLGVLLDEYGQTRLYACPPTMITGKQSFLWRHWLVAAD